MIETLNEFALLSLADSFETMAFISPMPAEGPYTVPADAVLLTIHFTGGSCGVVELVASRNLGKIVVCNTLGDDPQSQASYDDALKELLNVLGGLMLRRWIAESRESIEMSLPSTRVFDAKAEWPAFITSPGASVLDLEGNLVALRVCARERN